MTNIMNTETPKIELIAKDINYIQRDLAIITTSIKELSGVYPTKADLKTVSDKVEVLEKSSNLWKWLAPTLSAVLGSVVTFLVINYLTRV